MTQPWAVPRIRTATPEDLFALGVLDAAARRLHPDSAGRGIGRSSVGAAIDEGPRIVMRIRLKP
ncbi:hypothetical protein [Arthrobacter sp. TB 26]|uniref:hypothetical protein n=1 Tax=Arthrobacter sp. TB 26 TaxID=494420 RepID=UPI000FE14130|nr:hypothetical protein [Arthrobacter sp. TB 26]